MSKTKVSALAAVRDAHRQEKAWLASPLPSDATTGVTRDSFNAFSYNMGVGADNILSNASYGFNPISRNRTQLEWLYRGSWIAGQVVDAVADDMTREGVSFTGEVDPVDIDKIKAAWQRMGIWQAANDTIKWGRLYGGSICVMLIDGQNMKTPLKIETVGKGQFKGLLALDRWMLEPVLEDLVDDYGPFLGTPKYYRVQSNAPALRGQSIHYSRIAFRQEGIRQPYTQRLTENLWGISVVERLWDRMISYDLASTGAAQLVNKLYLRTFKVKDLRQIVTQGGANGSPALTGLMAQMNMMRRFQGQEGITLMDVEDEFEVQGTTAMSGVDACLDQFGQQLSGASQIPLTRLFGQSPGGMNATGESDMRNYYDSVSQKQEGEMHQGMVNIAMATAQSEGIALPDDFGIEFNPLWQLTEVEKATVATQTTTTIMSAKEGGAIPDKTVLQELRQMSHKTGVFTNITSEMIDAAEDQVLPELGVDPATGLPMAEPHPDDVPFDPKPAKNKLAFEQKQTAAVNKAKTKPKKVADGKVIEIRPQGPARKVARRA